MEHILTVNNLKTYYYSKAKTVPAVDGVSFTLKKGEVLGIVGESGCGKSTVARSVLGLLDGSYSRIEEGEILYRGRDLRKIGKAEMNRIRGKQISMIFQNPQASLNPVFTIGNQLSEVLTIHEGLAGKRLKNRVTELLSLVRIPSPETRVKDYPHQLSGGMQQRVLIAIALACNPEIIIADEPTTALDVTIEAQILHLMKDIQKKYGMGILLISHNMGVIAGMCQNVLVMYGGVVVEQGTTVDIFLRPRHPYTRGLLAAVPSIEDAKEMLESIPGTVPYFLHPVSGCRFAGRCRFAEEKCRQREPPLFDAGEGHRVRCWLEAPESGGDTGWSQ